MEIPGLGPLSPPIHQPEEDSVAKSNGDERTHFKLVRFMFEAGEKLHMKPIPLSTAAQIYHGFYRKCRLTAVDPYLIATTALYLAGKVEEEHLKLRDVINVSYRCLHPEKPPLDIGSNYWALRDSVAQCELFVLRVLKFNVSFGHPHKYLLHYLKSLLAWLPPEVVESVPLNRTAWALLRDSYHSNLCLHYSADQIAVSVIYLALQCHGIQVPYSHEAENTWWEALVEDIKLRDIRAIIGDIIEMYDLETTAPTVEEPT